MSKLLVITPVYNGEKFIEETIHSVLEASIKGMHYVVVDDGSTDRTPSILRKYAREIQIVSQNNLGESSAVNVGLAQQESEYICIVSADDLVHPDIFRKMIPELDSNPNLAVLYPDWQFLNSTGHGGERVETREYAFEELVGNMNCLPGPGSIIRRSSVGRNFLRDPSYKFCGDYECWLYLSLTSEFKRFPEILAFWRMHGENASIKGRSLEMANERVRVHKNFLELARNSESKFKIAKRGLAVAYMSTINLSYFDRRIPAFRNLLLSVLIYPFLRRDLGTIAYALLRPILEKFREFHLFQAFLDWIIRMRKR